MTPAARRRSSVEPHVRFWFIAGAVFIFAALVLGYGQWREWSYDTWLVYHGTLVEATIRAVDEVEREGFQVPPPADVTIQFELDGQKREVTGRIMPADGFKFVSPGKSIQIRVDPAIPQRWTARVKAESLLNQFVGAGILLAVGALALLIAIGRRGRMLAAWRNGDVIEGVIESVGRSAAAPHSWCVHWRPRDSRDKRLFTTYIPQRAGEIKKGDPLVLLGDPRHLRRAIVARMYQ
jgi:hypothetical protein